MQVLSRRYPIKFPGMTEVADAFPQTVVMGKDGLVEAVHVGFAGDEDLKKQLGDELGTLSAGSLLKSDGPDSTR